MGRRLYTHFLFFWLFCDTPDLFLGYARCIILHGVFGFMYVNEAHMQYGRAIVSDRLAICSNALPWSANDASAISVQVMSHSQLLFCGDMTIECSMQRIAKLIMAEIVRLSILLEMCLTWCSLELHCLFEK